MDCEVDLFGGIAVRATIPEQIELLAGLPRRKVMAPDEARSRSAARLAMTPAQLAADRRNRRCSACLKKFESIVGCEMHIRDAHAGQATRISVDEASPC